jgi:hypothetical protein
MPSSKTARKTSARGKKPAASKAPAKKTAAKKAPAKKATAKKAASPKAGGFGVVFTRLQEIMSQHEPALVVKADKPGNYTVVSPKPYKPYNNKELFFGAVLVGKNYVSYHFFPLYMCPELSQDLSPELKKRKQGKACFNFSTVDEALFQQLDALTRKGFELFRRRELV